MAEENLSVADSSEDGDDSDGTTWNPRTGPYAGDEYFRLGDRDTTRFSYGALRFLVPNIGQAESITSADLTVRCNGTPERGSGSLTVRVHGNDVDDCPALSATVRPAGTWTDTTEFDDATFTITVAADIVWDVTAIVQELVNRGSWAADNHMGFALRHTGGTYTQAQMVDYDTDTLANIATLDIVFGGVGGLSISIAMYHYMHNTGSSL